MGAAVRSCQETLPIGGADRSSDRICRKELPIIAADRSCRWDLPFGLFSFSFNQNPAVAGMCRAHGIAHQKVVRPADLAPALRSAWDLNRHSVVEVITNRETNVEQHRALQAAVRAAVLRALHAAVLLAPAPVRHAPGASGNGSGPPQQQQQGLAPGVWGALPPVHLRPPLVIRNARFQRYSLPLLQPLTTGACSRPGCSDLYMRSQRVDFANWLCHAHLCRSVYLRGNISLRKVLCCVASGSIWGRPLAACPDVTGFRVS